VEQGAARATLKAHPVWDLPRDFGHPVCFLAGCEPQPTGWRSHVHKGIELGVVFAGVHEERLGGEVQTCGPGDTWVCAMWEPHAWRSRERDTCVAVITFLPEALDDTILDRNLWLNMLSLPPAERPRPRTEGQRSRVFSLAYELYEEVREQRPHGQTAKLLGLYRLLFELERWWQPSADHGARSSVRAQVADYDRVRPAVELVEAAGGQRVRPEQAARVCGLSKSRFHLLFRRAMGVSFYQFSMRVRVGIAAHRLLASDDSLATIADRLGFVDASHLHRTFVKQCGSTPHEYRLGRTLPPKSAQFLATGSLMLSPEESALSPAREVGRAQRARGKAPGSIPSLSYYHVRQPPSPTGRRAGGAKSAAGADAGGEDRG